MTFSRYDFFSTLRMTIYYVTPAEAWNLKTGEQVLFYYVITIIVYYVIIIYFYYVTVILLLLLLFQAETWNLKPENRWADS